MPIKTCAWVRARLPLLAGGDSLGLDRRLVDRHLVRCDDCRHRLEALGRSLEALRDAAAADVPADAAEPLWPDLARRIRQARRPRPRTAWGFETRWAWAWPFAGLAAGLLVALSIVGVGAHNDPRIGEIVNDYVPIPQFLPVDFPTLRKPEDPEQFERIRRRPAPRPDVPYREAHASDLADEGRPRPSSVDERLGSELTQ